MLDPVELELQAHGGWQLNSGLLEKQQVLLPTESSLQSLGYHLSFLPFILILLEFFSFSLLFYLLLCWVYLFQNSKKKKTAPYICMVLSLLSAYPLLLFALVFTKSFLIRTLTLVSFFGDGG